MVAFSQLERDSRGLYPWGPTTKPGLSHRAAEVHMSGKRFHFVFEAEDYDRSVAFYRDVLQLPVVDS